MVYTWVTQADWEDEPEYAVCSLEDVLALLLSDDEVGWPTMGR